jgi:hypothetical protein
MLLPPFSPQDLLNAVVDPALAYLPYPMDSVQARVLLLAIAGQESGMASRVQKGGGPARSFWQMEREAVAEVLSCPDTATHAVRICTQHGLAATVDAVYAALLDDDTLGATFARLNLWACPDPLPDGEAAAYAYYVNVWRPGKPDSSRWGPWYRSAVTAVAQCS